MTVVRCCAGRDLVEGVQELRQHVPDQRSHKSVLDLSHDDLAHRIPVIQRAPINILLRHPFIKKAKKTKELKELYPKE